MKQDVLSFDAQVEIRSDFFYKLQLLFVLFFVFFSVSYSAQELQSETGVKSDAVITVVGDAFIYSKDQNFNAQVSNNKDLQKNSKVELTQNNEVVIRGKSVKELDQESIVKKRKTDNVVLVSKKEKKNKQVNLPKKDILIHIKALDDSNKFFASVISGNVSFIAPSNDYNISGCFLNIPVGLKNSSVEFSFEINYFYNNDNYKSQLFYSDLSVRPPPSGLI